MMAYGPRTPEQLKQAKEDARKWEAEEPWRKKVKKLEARIAKQDRIINMLTTHIKKRGGDDLILDLLEALTEEGDDLAAQGPRFTIDESSKDGHCITMHLEGREYIGTLRLYKDEEGEVLE